MPAFAIGLRGGIGAATIANGSVVTISNPGSAGAGLNVGGTPLLPLAASGVLTVSNSQINVTAAPGQATVRIGHDGNGIATFTGSTLNVGNPTGDAADGSLIVAGQAGLDRHARAERRQRRQGRLRRRGRDHRRGRAGRRR